MKQHLNGREQTGMILHWSVSGSLTHGIQAASLKRPHPGRVIGTPVGVGTGVGAKTGVAAMVAVGTGAGIAVDGAT